MTLGKTEQKRELLAAYKARPIVGGVCAIQNQATGRLLLYATPNSEGQRNRFEFSVSTDHCIQAALAADWKEHGKESFTFQILEELEKKPEQTEEEFRSDLEALEEIWREKLEGEGTVFY